MTAVIPVWHQHFMQELTGLAPGYITGIQWEVGTFIRVEFKYLGHYVGLMFNDQNNVAMLAINGTMQYYEYADPDFTPNKVLKDIRGKT